MPALGAARSIALALLLAASGAAKQPDRLYFIGTLAKTDVDVTIKLLPNNEVLGATLRKPDDLRLLRGSRAGKKLALHEVDLAGRETATIEARIVGHDLKGKWQKRTFDFWEPPMNETPLMYDFKLAHPAFGRLHDALRANDWNRATNAAQWACGAFDIGCTWLAAIPDLAKGRLPPGDFQPWSGLFLEREGKFDEAIKWYRQWCGMEYETCLLLNDLAPRMQIDERQKLYAQLCQIHRLDCDEVFGAPQVALSDAARRGDVAAVERLLRDGAKVNFGSESVWSPLLGATFAESLPIAKLLLDHGADPNAAYGYEPPLEAAVQGKRDDIAFLLLDRGAKPGWIELWQVVYARRHALARKLVEKGADVNDTVPAGAPLTAAVDNGDVEMVTFLLARGADPDVETKYSRGSPIDHARQEHRTKILKMLLAARRNDEDHRAQ